MNDNNPPPRLQNPISIIEKMKKEREGYSYVPAEYERNHNTFVILFLAIQIIGAIIAIFFLFGTLSEIDALAERFSVMDFSGERIATYLSIFILILTIICAVGMLNWQDWGAKGLIALYALSIVIAFIAGNWIQVGINIFAIVILNGLINQNEDYQHL